jgi:tetratricopeptide (TPR) repeat protein
MTERTNTGSGHPRGRFGHLRHLLSCDACGEKNPPHCCARCHLVYYCSAECQGKHWKQGHKAVCKAVAATRLNFEKGSTDFTNIPNSTLRKVCLILWKAERFIRGSAEWKEGFRSAMPEVAKVLDAEPVDATVTATALHLKARILIVLDEPMEAIKIVKGIDGWDDYFTLHYCLAEAYEALGLWKQAEKEYYTTMVHCQKTLNCGNFGVRALFGMSRVAYQMKNYVRAIHWIDQLIQQHRPIRGAHKLLALPLLALAKSSTTTELVYGHSPTLAGAIEVMYKGLVYEEQWDEINMQANRSFLRELLDQAAASEETTLVG